jgi:uncharacterized spore protein YtfJ
MMAGGDPQEGTMDDTRALTIQPLEQMLDRLNASAVLGQPEDRGDVTVIPVAEIIFGLGFGMGTGAETSPDAEAEAEGESAGPTATPGGRASRSRPKVKLTVDGQDVPVASTLSGGGGGGGRARPIGYIKIGPDGAKYEPIVDASRLALAGIVLAAWIAFWVTYTVRAIAGALTTSRRD